MICYLNSVIVSCHVTSISTIFVTVTIYHAVVSCISSQPKWDGGMGESWGLHRNTLSNLFSPLTSQPKVRTNHEPAWWRCFSLLTKPPGSAISAISFLPVNQYKDVPPFWETKSAFGKNHGCTCIFLRPIEFGSFWNPPFFPPSLCRNWSFWGAQIHRSCCCCHVTLFLFFRSYMKHVCINLAPEVAQCFPNSDVYL